MWSRQAGHVPPHVRVPSYGREPPLELLAWKSLPPAHSIALRLQDSSQDSKKLWKLACARAIRVLSKIPIPREEFDWRDHQVHGDEGGAYAYCIKCFVTRKTTDNRHIAARPFLGALLGWTCADGEYICVNNHRYRMHVRKWKRAGYRPAFACATCGFWAWPWECTFVKGLCDLRSPVSSLSLTYLLEMYGHAGNCCAH